jgi:hypothetical protein
MSPKQRDRWAKTRALGRRHFILVRGICCWGGSMLVCMTAFFYFLDRDSTFGYWLWLSPALLSCPLAGYIWGAWVWRSAEKEYLRGELSVMDMSPTDGQERFLSRVLIPFKVYVVVASVWLFYSALEAHSKHIVMAEFSAYLLIIYAICIPFFVLAALIQFVGHWRRRALVSISFALAASIILAILWEIIKGAVA